MNGRSHAHRLRGDAWGRAYRFAVANAALFALLSCIGAALSIDAVAWGQALAVLYWVGATLAFVRLQRSGGGLAFIAFFVLGSGVFFGFGTAYATLVHSDTFQAFFPVWAQGEQLRRINLLNSVSVLIVLLTAWPLCNVRVQELQASDQIGRLLDVLAQFRTPLMVASVIAVAAILATFPGPANPLVAGAMHALAPLPLISIVFTFARPQPGDAIRLAVAAALVVVLTALGVLREDKTTVMMPLVAMAAGLWLHRSSRRLAIAFMAVCLAAFFAVLAPLTANARAHSLSAGGVSSLADASEYVADGWKDLVQGQAGLSEDRQFMARFSTAPFQAFMMDQYSEGRPGDSLKDVWVAAIPRILWPEKPEITRFGRQLYGLVSNTHDPKSALAPTYTAEAYWNGGWLAVALISVVIGLELGWLTRKWLVLTRGQSREVGVLVMAIPAAVFAFWIEAWIAAAYVGGFLTLALIIGLIDAVSRHAAPRARRQPSNALILERGP